MNYLQGFQSNTCIFMYNGDYIYVHVYIGSERFKHKSEYVMFCSAFSSQQHKRKHSVTTPDKQQSAAEKTRTQISCVVTAQFISGFVSLHRLYDPSSPF